MKIKSIVAIVLCLSILTSNVVYATELPPTIPPVGVGTPDHFGLMEETPQQEEEEPAPDYNCSLGCSHLPSEPHNYIPFNVYGDETTKYLGRGRAAIITVDLTSTGGAGSAPLKCLTQYEQDDNQHWERCINHPGTGTYNGLYHNAGRVNISNHNLSLTPGGVINCINLPSLPKKVCSVPTCGYARPIGYGDFPLTYEGKYYVFTDTRHRAATDFLDGKQLFAYSWSNTGHGMTCITCGAWLSYTDMVTGREYCPGDPTGYHDMDWTTGYCKKCGLRNARHTINQIYDSPYTHLGHIPRLNKCTTCGIENQVVNYHNGDHFCNLCGLEMMESFTHDYVSGAPNAPGGINYRFVIKFTSGLSATTIDRLLVAPHVTENGAVIPDFEIPVSQGVISADKKTMTLDYNIPQNLDKRHQNTFPYYLHVMVSGMASDGIRFQFGGNFHRWDPPDGIKPYAGIASPENGTSAAWLDSVNINVKAKDDWSNQVVFKILDSDRTTQLGSNYTVPSRDGSQYFNGQFKLIAEAAAPKQLYLKVTDICGNFELFPFTVQYVDTQSPRIQAAPVDNNAWARSKTVRFSSIEAGSRETVMSFNDGTVWNTCNQSGDTYYQDYIFTGDVYTAQTRPIFFKDKLANTSQAMFTINRLDNTKPTISSVSAVSNSIKTESTITVAANDSKAGIGEGSGVKQYAMTTTNVAPSSGWQASNVFKTTTNGTYYLWCKDGVDWVSNSYTTSVTNLDKIAPTINLSAPTAWTNGNVTITAQAADENSGVNYITLPNGANVSSANATYTATANGVYNFTVFDKAGNSKSSSITITCIDRVAPTLDLSASTAWTNSFVDITAAIADDYSGIDTLMNPDGTTVKSASSTFRVTSNGTYSFTLKDKAGNTTIKSITVSAIDKVNPEISLTAPSAWTNQDVPISFAGTDDYSGVEKITLPDGTITSNFKTTFIATLNKVYSFLIHDKAGNSVTRSINISCIDRVKPSIVLTAPTEWTNKPVTITAVATDDYSGVATITNPNGVVAAANEITFEVAANGTYEFVVFDKAGNEFKQSITVSCIDYVVPTISLSSPTEWTNKPFNITIETNDDYSGVSRIKLPDNTEPTTATSFEVSKNGTYSFTVYDKAGNSTTDAVTITCFDYVAPTAIPSNLPTDWLVRPHEITVTADDDYSGVKRIKTPDDQWHDDVTSVTYFVFENKVFPFVIEDKAGNTYTLEVPIDYVENTDPTIEITGNPDKWTNGDVKLKVKAADPQSGIRGISLAGGKFEPYDEVNFLFAENGEYTFVAEDNVGHRTEKKVTIDKIDKDSPTGSYTVTPKDWTKGDVTVEISAQDPLSGLKSMSDTQSFTLSSNGTMHMKIQDNAGNIFTLPIEVKNIDKDEPVVDGIGIAAVSRGQAPLLIASSDKTSPVVRTEYQLVELNGTVKDDKWVEWKDGVKINAPFHGDVAARCIDSAGNISEVLRKEFMIDPIPPRARARMSTLAPTTEPIIITYSAADMESGFNYTILPDKIITNEPEVEYQVETNGNYTFQSYDYAGNTKSTKVTVTNLDKDPPLGKVTQYPTEWTKGNVELHLTATDASAVTRLEPKDQIATDNGSYDFYLEDEHGNKVKLTHKVSNIDRIAPSIQGSASNFLASIYVEDYESGVKQTVTPLGSSSSSTIMFSVSPNTSYAISAIDNAGNTSTRTLYVNANGEGSFDGTPPDSSNPDGNGNDGSGSGVAGGNGDINTGTPNRDPNKPDRNDNDYDYGKPQKNYPTAGTPGTDVGVQEPSATSSSSSTSSKPPHIGFEDNKSSSSSSTAEKEQIKKPVNDTPKKSPDKAPTVIVPSKTPPNSIFEVDAYLKQISDESIALGNLQFGKGWRDLIGFGSAFNIAFTLLLSLSAVLLILWILWILLFALAALKKFKQKQKGEWDDEDGEEDETGTEE